MTTSSTTDQLTAFAGVDSIGIGLVDEFGCLYQWVVEPQAVDLDVRDADDRQDRVWPADVDTDKAVGVLYTLGYRPTGDLGSVDTWQHDGLDGLMATIERI